MDECGICHEEYRKDDLEQHRKTCILRSMFRCSICCVDYLSKEGMWNHLDLHEIADESKEQYYHDVKAKHKIHQCVLCNDQRCYLESAFWKHVQDVHDGFFLRCSECGENFKSENLMKDHTKSHIKNKVKVELDDTKVDAACLNLAIKEQIEREVENGNVTNISDAENVLLSTIPGEANDLPLELRFQCKLCELRFATYKRLRRHKWDVHGRKHKCPHCRRFFQLEELPTHLASCEKKMFTCEVCHLKFDVSRYLAKHMKIVHGMKLDFETINTENEKKKDCPHCNKKCADAQSLLEHVRKTHKPTECGICGIVILGAEKARYHEVIKHTEPMFKCPRCSRNFHWKKHLIKHSRVCGSLEPTDMNYDSNIDEPECNSEPTLKDMSEPDVMVANPSSKASWIKCPHCEKRVLRADTLARHINMYHVPVTCDTSTKKNQKKVQNKISKKQEQDKVKTEPSPSLPEENKVSNFKKETDSSNACSDAQIAQQNKNSHTQDDTNSQTAENGLKSDCKTSSDHSMELPIDAEIMLQLFVENYSNNQYRCTICGMTMSSYQQAKYHKLTRHTEEQYKCLYCPMKFHLNQRFQRHMSICASRKYSCDICDQKFKSEKFVHNHKERVHHISKPILNEGRKRKSKKSQPVCASGGLPKCSCKICRLKNGYKYKCHHCPQMYQKKSRYLNHISKCKEKKYSCDSCDKRFTTITHVQRHTKQQHQGKNAIDAQSQPQSDNTELQMEIKVEDTMLQEEEFQVPNEAQKDTSTPASGDQLNTDMDFITDKSKGDNATDAALLSGVKIKEEPMDADT